MDSLEQKTKLLEALSKQDPKRKRREEKDLPTPERVTLERKLVHVKFPSFSTMFDYGSIPEEVRQRIVREIFGEKYKGVRFELIVEENYAKKETTKTTKKERCFGTKLDPRNTFESLVIGPHNRQQVSLVRMLEEDSPLFPSLLLIGKSGTGKTVLAQATGNQKEDAFYSTIAAFAEDLLRPMKDRNPKEYPSNRARLKEAVTGAKMVIIDEIDEIRGEDTPNLMAEIIDELIRKRTPMIYTCQTPPEKLERKFNPSLRTRLIGLTRVEMRYPTPSEATKLIQDVLTKQYGARIKIGRGVAEEVVRAIQNKGGNTEDSLNYRALLGGAGTLAGYGISGGFETITTELVRKALPTHSRIPEGTKITPRMILEEYARRYDENIKAMLRGSDAKACLGKRAVAMAIMEQLPGTTTIELGEILGYGGHPGALHVLKTARKKIEEGDRELQQRVDYLRGIFEKG